jgi:hypothetical protein
MVGLLEKLGESLIVYGSLGQIQIDLFNDFTNLKHVNYIFILIETYEILKIPSKQMIINIREFGLEPPKFSKVTCCDK